MTNIVTNWTFGEPLLIEEFDGYKNVVVSIPFTITCTDTVSGVSDSFSLSVGLDYGNVATLQFFTPFEQLTKEQVVTWISQQPNIDIQKIEYSLIANIKNKMNPPTYINKPFNFS